MADEDDRRVDGRELVGVELRQRGGPNTTSAIIVTTVTIGLLIAKSEMNMSAS